MTIAFGQSSNVTFRTSTAPAEVVDYSWIAGHLAEYDRSIFSNEVDGIGANVVVALHEDTPVAGIVFIDRLGWTHIERLWVEPQFRRSGLASQLINQCEAHAVSKKHLGMRVSTTSGHTALSLYRSLDFRVDARWTIRATPSTHIYEVALSKVCAGR